MTAEQISALGRTLFAGLATGLGGLLALGPKPTPRAMAAAMGFAAGVMTAVSLTDLLPTALGWYRRAFSPEGAALALVSLLCLGMALAVALHNLPEGLAVALPLYYATGSRRRAVGAAFASGLAEPAGAVLAYALVGGRLRPGFLNGLLVLVAGVMVWVSLAQLVPTALTFGGRRASAAGFGAGVAVMAIGIALLS